MLFLLIVISTILLWVHAETVILFFSRQEVLNFILAIVLFGDVLIFALLYAQADAYAKGVQLAQSTQQLKESEGRLFEIIEGLSIAVFVINRAHRVTQWNRACEVLTGRKARDMLGTNKHWSAFYAKERPILADLVVDGVLDLDSYEPGTVERSSLLDGAYQGEAFFEKVGKQGLWISFTAAPIRDAHGTVIGAVETLVDTTKIKETERMKSEFLSIAAHQLRTPLGSMRWMMEMLTSGDLGKLPSEAQGMIDQLHENTKRLIRLVGDLLNVSRIEQGRVKDAPERADLVALGRKIVGEIKLDAKRRQVRILFQSHERTLFKVIDPNRFQEVVENLLSNAVKYNHPGGTVRVSLRKEGAHILFQVFDTGSGIPKQDQPHLFSKFFRASNAQKGSVDGSGLGLFVVKSYVEAWGGTIRFVSQEGKGSTFTVSLPIRSRS